MWWSDTRTHGQMINPNNTSNHHIVPICVFLPNSGISGNTILLITFLKKKSTMSQSWVYHGSSLAPLPLKSYIR